MRYLIIDPAAKTVSEHDAPKLHMKFFYREMDCQQVQPVALAAGVDMWVDENGLLGEKPDPQFFTITNSGQVFTGRALVCGHDAAGNFAAAPAGVTVARLWGVVGFLGGEADVEAAIARGEVDRPESSIAYGDGQRDVFWSWHPAVHAAEAR